MRGMADRLSRGASAVTGALVAAPLLAACGGGGAAPGAASSPTTSGAATATPAKAKAEPKAKASVVTIKGFEYGPAKITVKPGAKVTWVDEDATNHTVTFASKDVKSIPNIRQGQSRTVRFGKAGTYAYVCEYHPNMRAEVVVAR